jgi:hypothetical protein
MITRSAILLVMTQMMASIGLAEPQWYPFLPTNEVGESAIGMEDWNSEPAGKHGRIESKDDKLIYNGREIKLWGLNNTYIACAPEKALAEKRAATYRKFGINAMRLHKYADGPGWAGILEDDSFLNFKAPLLDRMDYYVHVLAQNGIYTKLSPTFGVKIGRQEFDRIPFINEVTQDTTKQRTGTGHGMVYLSKEIQDLQIEQTLKVLNHVNPYTKAKYAEDPAIFCVELFNEDSVLFGAQHGVMHRIPTLRKRTSEAFSKWLLDKYGSEQAWRQAWGEGVIVSDPANIANPHLKHLLTYNNQKGRIEPESLQAGTVVPWGSPWFYDSALTSKDEQLTALRQRMLDSMQFLIGLQNDFYERFAKAIRETGFDGEIIASNWQAGSLAGHLYNLHSDAQIGMIDRHNYYGGGRGATRSKKPFASGSMLAIPGSGTLSAGLQQVDDLPFMLSEWIHVQPNEWYVEGPAVLGAYGWGLNGWDVSYIFQNNDTGGFSDRIGKQDWDVMTPMVIGIYPAVSRQIRRLDVTESPETIALNVHVPSLADGKLSFHGRTSQQWDQKSFTTDQVPMQALAVKRVAIDFVEQYQETPKFDPSEYLKDGAYVSVTNQLRWTPAPEGQKNGGYFTMNTPGTKAFVGFAPGDKTFDLGDGFAITPAKGFSAIYLSAKGESEVLTDASQIVLVAMARGRNTGMTFNTNEDVVEALGEPPLLLEPVKAEISLPGVATLHVLDHDGRQTSTTRPANGTVTIDGSTDKTPFYLIRR